MGQTSINATFHRKNSALWVVLHSSFSVHRTSCQKEDKAKTSHDTLLCYSLTKWAGPLDIYRHSVISTIMLQNISKTVEHLVPVSFHWFEIIGRTRYHFRGIHMTEDLHEGERHKQTFKSHQDYITFRKNIKFIIVFRLEGRQTWNSYNMKHEYRAWERL